MSAIAGLDGRSVTRRSVLAMPRIGRILVIDAARVQCVIVEHCAAAIGIDVDWTGEPAVASRLLCQQRYDAVVLDLSLDGAGGRELLQIISQAGGRPRLVFTGADRQARDTASWLASTLDLDVAGSAAKPFELASLRATLRDAIAGGGTGERSARLAAVDAAELGTALAAGEVTIAFQPQIELATLRPVGAEALARWTSARFGFVPPDVFVPLAVRSGMAALLVDIALRAALVACASWRCTRPEITVSVNLPAASLRDSGLPSLINARLAEARLSPEALVVEIVEADAVSCRDALGVLSGHGIGIAIDDACVEAIESAAAQLGPAGIYKLGRASVEQVATDDAAFKRLRAAAAAATAVRREIAAIGVETEAVAERLRSAGCARAQGWRYGPAMSASAVQRWLAEQPR